MRLEEFEGQKYRGIALEELSDKLNLNNPSLTVEKRIDNLARFMGNELQFDFPEYTDIEEKLYKLAKNDRLRPKNKVRIAEVFKKGQEEDYPISSYIEEFGDRLRGQADQGPGSDYPIRSLPRWDDNAEKDKGNVFYTGQDILNLGFFPHSCTSYEILAFDLLKEAGIESEVWYWMVDGTRGGHAVLHFWNENGEEKRADPKWEYRKNDEGIPYVEANPERVKKFRDPQEGFVHVARNDSYDAQKPLRPMEKWEEFRRRLEG